MWRNCLLYPKIFIFFRIFYDHPLPLGNVVLDGNGNLWSKAHVLRSSFITMDVHSRYSYKITLKIIIITIIYYRVPNGPLFSSSIVSVVGMKALLIFCRIGFSIVLPIHFKCLEEVNPPQNLFLIWFQLLMSHEKN